MEQTLRRSLRRGLLGAAILSLTALAHADPIADAVRDGHFDFAFRYRIEHVSEHGFAHDATASTLRSRLGYTTGRVHDFALHAAFEDIRVIGNELYNSTANGLTRYPTVADPADTELDEAYLDYAGFKNAKLRLGRQRIALDDQRFVGAVGFRQNEQTFDAFSARGTDGKLQLFYAYLGRADRIFGAHHPNPAKAHTDLDAHLINAGYDFGPVRVVGYAYLIDTPDTPTAAHKDLGLRARGRLALDGSWSLGYLGEYARQSGYRDGAAGIDANYTHIELQIARRSLSARLGQEVLGGDGSSAFQTPLATLHAFQGWADRFLVTPVNGIRDLYAGVSGKLDVYALKAIYHRFDADTGGARYGSEIDLGVSRTFHEQYSAGVQYADYTADTFGSDTRIIWMTVQARY